MIGKRCCYGVKGGLISFGNIVSYIPEEDMYIIRDDSGKIYHGSKDSIVILKAHDKEEIEE